MFLDDTARGASLPEEVLTPGQDGYGEAARTLFAAGTPDMVVRPTDAAGVAAALRYASEAGLTVSVRSGGHSMAGLSTHTEGIVIDLRRITGVEVLDGSTRRVRVGAGATWGTVAAALHPHGLGISAGDTNQVGVGGLTLGGGIGWLVRRYGLAIDSLAGAEVVAADGRVLRADASKHGDLFWALRGGGGNFGVVTSFDFTAQPVDIVHFGTIRYQPSDLSQLIASWRDVMRASDDNLTTALTLIPPMAGQPASATLMCCYADRDGAAAARALSPFRRLGPVIRDDVRAVRYPQVLEDVRQLGGLRIVIRNIFVRALGDGLIAAVEALFRGGGAVLSLRSLGGAATRVPVDATAFAHREAEAMLVANFVLPADTPPGQIDDVLARWKPLAAHGTGAYVNFLGSATGTDVATAYPPPTYRRLAIVKRAYDPDNVFHRNHNIEPAATDRLGSPPGPAVTPQAGPTAEHHRPAHAR